MELKLTPNLEEALLTVAAKIRGARGGKARTAKKLRASRRNQKIANKARLAQAAA